MSTATGGASGSGGATGSGGSKSAGSGGSKASGSGGSVTSGGSGNSSGSGNNGGSSNPGGSGNTGGSGPSNDSYAQARQDCVDRINGFRATEGLPPLERWTSAESCADGQAESDSISGDAHGAFGECDENAQNECPGWGSVDDIVQDYLQAMRDEGPGEPYSEHGRYIYMSSTQYTMVSCGFFETSDGEIWPIQNFR